MTDFTAGVCMRGWALAAAAAALLAASGGLAAAGGAQPFAGAVVFLLVAAVGGLFLLRAEAGVCALLVVRPALDVFGTRGGPAAAAGLALIALIACAGWALLHLRDARTAPAVTAVLPLVAAVLVSSALSAAPFASLALAAPVCASLAVYATVGVLLARGMDPRLLVAAVLAGCVAPAVVGLSQSARAEGWIGPDGIARAQGTFAHPNPFGATLALGLVLLVVLVQSHRALVRIAACVGALPLLHLLAASGSRSAWLAAGIGVLAVMARRSLRHAAAAVAVMAVLFATPVAQERLGDLSSTRQLNGKAANSAVWRIDYGSAALELAARSPVTGLGLGGVARASATGKDPHNDAVRVVVDLGAVGVLAYGALVVHLLRRFTAEWGRPPTVGGSCALGAIGAAAVLSLSTNFLGSFAVMTPVLAICAIAHGDGARRLAGSTGVPGASVASPAPAPGP
ncbi:MAG: O-antigen ligase family protein [Acidimicrobiales bacterium]